MALRATGRLIRKFDTVQVSEKFKKRELVIEIEDGKYPQSVSFQLTGDKCSQLDQFEIDQIIEIDFNLRGREWTSPKGEVKFFNTLDVWKINGGGGNGQRSEPQRKQVAAAAFDGPGDDLDIPFAYCE